MTGTSPSQPDSPTPLSMFVSELSLGPAGWVQILNFLVTGALVVVFGRGLALYSRSGAASRAGSVLLQIIGLGLMASGLFATDASALGSPVSTHGIIHGILGAVVFSLAPVSCFLFSRSFRRDRPGDPLPAGASPPPRSSPSTSRS